MSFTKSSTLIAAVAFISRASAHGIVNKITAGGVDYQGYDPSFQYQNPPPTVAGWSIPQDQDRGFVSDYSSPDINCHKGATPGGAYVKVAAGGTVDLQWTEWPESHHGPMIDYLASCGDDCTTVSKTSLKWNKIDEAGLIDGSTPPGKWASDTLIANGNKWTATIPSSIAPGKYVLRHETIALHSANNAGGAQNYPQCINLEITGSGSDSLSGGTVGTSLYTAQDPGIFVNIYQKLASYAIPGPALYSGAGSSNPQPSGGNGGSGSTTTPSATSTTATLPLFTTTAAPTTFITRTKTTSTTSADDFTISDEPIKAISTTSVAPVTTTDSGPTGPPTKFVCYADH